MKRLTKETALLLLVLLVAFTKYFISLWGLQKHRINHVIAMALAVPILVTIITVWYVDNPWSSISSVSAEDIGLASDNIDITGAVKVDKHSSSILILKGVFQLDTLFKGRFMDNIQPDLGKLLYGSIFQKT